MKSQVARVALCFLKLPATIMLRVKYPVRMSMDRSKRLSSHVEAAKAEKTWPDLPVRSRLLSMVLSEARIKSAMDALLLTVGDIHQLLLVEDATSNAVIQPSDKHSRSCTCKAHVSLSLVFKTTSKCIPTSSSWGIHDDACRVSAFASSGPRPENSRHQKSEPSSFLLGAGI